MKVGNLLRGPAAPSPTALLTIPAGEYRLPKECCRVRGWDVVKIASPFQTTLGQLTAGTVRAVASQFPNVKRGLFVQHKPTGSLALWAAGQEGYKISDFDTIDLSSLPPEFSLETIKKIKTAIETRDVNYEWLGKPHSLFPSLCTTCYGDKIPIDDREAAPFDDIFQATAIAQLLGDSNFQKNLLGLSGAFYARLLSGDELEAVMSLPHSDDLGARSILPSRLLDWVRDVSVDGRPVYWDLGVRHSNDDQCTLAKLPGLDYNHRGLIYSENGKGVRVGFFVKTLT